MHACISVRKGPMPGHDARGIHDRSTTRYTGFSAWIIFLVATEVSRSTIMFPRCGFLIMACCAAIGMSLPATYDQRQTGDLNVEIHLKDVKIVALLDTELLDDYMDPDYFYEYADFTIKPITRSTTISTTSIEPSKAPLETTEKDQIASDADKQNLTIVATVSEATNDNVTLVQADVTSEIDKIETTTSDIKSTEDLADPTSALKLKGGDKLVDESDDTDATTKSIAELSTEKPVQQLSRKRCRSGYLPNGNGRCRRLNQRRVSFLPLAMKFAPKLLREITHSTKNLTK